MRIVHMMSCKLLLLTMNHHKTVLTPYGYIDEKLARMIVLLNDNGFETIGSCQGGPNDKIKCKDCRFKKERAYILFPGFDQVHRLISVMAKNGFCPVTWAGTGGFDINWLGDPKKPDNLMPHIAWYFRSDYIEDFTSKFEKAFQKQSTSENGIVSEELQ